MMLVALPSPASSDVEICLSGINSSTPKSVAVVTGQMLGSRSTAWTLPGKEVCSDHCNPSLPLTVQQPKRSATEYRTRRAAIISIA